MKTSNPEMAMLWKTLFAEMQRGEQPRNLSPEEWKRMQWAGCYPFKDRRAIYNGLVRRGLIAFSNGSRLTDAGRAVLTADRKGLAK